MSKKKIIITFEATPFLTQWETLEALKKEKIKNWTEKLGQGKYRLIDDLGILLLMGACFLTKNQYNSYNLLRVTYSFLYLKYKSKSIPLMSNKKCFNYIQGHSITKWTKKRWVVGVKLAISLRLEHKEYSLSYVDDEKSKNMSIFSLTASLHKAVGSSSKPDGPMVNLSLE